MHSNGGYGAAGCREGWTDVHPAMIAALPWANPSPLTERALFPARAGRLRAALGWTLAALAVVILRFHDWILRPRLWAEDGNVFFLDARQEGLSSVFKPYAGYVHLIPRLVAWMGSYLDPSRIPAFYVGSALVLTLGVVAWILCAQSDLPLRPLLALAVVAVPSTGEVFLCPTNLQWIAALALIAVPLTRAPRGGAAWGREALLVLVVGLTGPFSVVLAPAYLLRAAWTRSLTAAFRFLILLIPATVQAVSMVRFPAVPVPGSPTGPLHLANLLAVGASRLPLSFLPGRIGALVGPAWAEGVGIAVVVAALVAAAWPGRQRSERVYLLFVGFSLLGSAVFRCRMDTWAYPGTGIGDRYFYLPRVMGLWLLCPACAAAVRRPGILAALSLLAAGASWSAWEASLQGGAAERPYVDWSEFCGPLREGRSVQVTVSPGWIFLIPAQGHSQPGDLPAEEAGAAPVPLPSRILWSNDAYFYVVLPRGRDPSSLRVEGLPRGLFLDRGCGAIRGIAREPGACAATILTRGDQGWMPHPLELEFRHGELLTRLTAPHSVPANVVVDIRFAAFSSHGTLDFIDVTDLTTGTLVTRLEATPQQRCRWEGSVAFSSARPGMHALGFRFVCCDRAHKGSYRFEDHVGQVLVVSN